MWYKIDKYKFRVSNNAFGYVINIKNWLPIFESAIQNFTYESDNLYLNGKPVDDTYVLELEIEGMPNQSNLGEFKSILISAARKNKWSHVIL